MITLSFSKTYVFKMFHTKRKADVFNLLGFEERFQKALFSRRIGVDGRTNRRNRVLGVLWIGPQCSIEMESFY